MPITDISNETLQTQAGLPLALAAITSTSRQLSNDYALFSRGDMPGRYVSTMEGECP